MPSETLFSFMAASVVLNATPGADVMMTLAVGLKNGSRAALGTAFGVSVGVLCHALIVAFGVGAVVSQSPQLLSSLKLFGAGYLTFLGVQAWRAPPNHLVDAPEMPVSVAVKQGLLVNLLNPKVALFMLVFLPPFIADPLNPFAEVMFLGSVFATTSFIITGGYGLLAAQVSSRFTQHGARIQRCAGIVYVALAIAFLM